MKLVECPIPRAKLPQWVRPWPEAGTDLERVVWLSELRDAAVATGKNAHLRDYCALQMLSIAHDLRGDEIARLEEVRRTLEKRLSDRLNMTAKDVTDRVFEVLSARIEAEVERRVKTNIEQIELRFRREKAYEDALLKRVGELAASVELLERQVRDLGG